MNHNSVSRVNNSKYDEDYKTITNYINEFKHLEDKVGINWNLQKITFNVLTPVFNENLEIQTNNDGSFNINKDNLHLKQNYKYLIDFANDLCTKYYNICILIIEKNLFQSNGNKQQAFDLCLFLINNKISDRKVFIYSAICYYYCNDIPHTLEYIQKSQYMINKYPVLQEFYNTHKHKCTNK